ncbi:MAG TPA: LON peptidase substrate-binding domain-containing protein [Burkholderiales bacterium]|nr:LON peptidase substrate-binding domain-containing protein [Burkholderiales bacterium]
MSLLQQLKQILPPLRQTIPVFPLNTVLFPGGILPLKVFEQRYMDMAKECIKHGSVFAVCLIREGQEVGAPATPEPIGCTARITEWDMEQLGVLQIRTLGESRLRIMESSVNDKGLIMAHAEMLPMEDDVDLPPEFSGCAELVRKVVENAGEKSFAKPYYFESASWVGYRLSEFLPLKIAAKQKLMELSDPIARLQILAHFLTQQGLLK